MPQVEEAANELTIKHFEEALNQHGYGFTYAVLEVINSERQGWRLAATEFPVEIQGKSTRIDFVLRHWRNNVLLTCECKRANPATANWCFAKATDVSQLDRAHLNMVVVEDIRQTEPGGAHKRTGMNAWTTELLHHVACEVKTDETGDKGGRSVDQIEGAVTQVLRGMNGLGDWMVRNPSVIPKRDEGLRPVGFIPVIFTTAALWSSSVDLSTTDLKTGRVKVARSDLKRVPWLHYQYYQSPGLVGALPPAHVSTSLVEALHNEFTRTVAFVSPDGITEFLRQTSKLIVNRTVTPAW